jgi:hypothetical protein
MITKDYRTYSIKILRQEKILRDHEPLGMPTYAVKSEISGLNALQAAVTSARDEADAP